MVEDGHAGLVEVPVGEGGVGWRGGNLREEAAEVGV